MNKKLIAVAVAGVVAAPAAYADISAYGRIQNRIQITDNGTTETQDVSTTGSRFGFKGSGDIGNGMSAFARYEFSTVTDHDGNDSDDASDDPIWRSRLGYVGLSGPFGSISLGQQWSAYYNNVGTYASPNIANGPGQQLGPFRTGNTLKYSNSVGPIAFAIDGRIDDGGDGGGNGFGIGATLSAMDNVTLSGAFDSNDSSGADTAGFSATAGFGILHFILSHENQEVGAEESTNTVVGLSAGVTDQLTLSVAMGQTETEEGGQTTSETDRMNAYATYRLGGGLRIWAEMANTDSGSSETDAFAVGLRMDF